MEGDLFAGQRAPARRSDPDTSHKAAEAISPSLPTIREEVLAFALARGDGFIDEELIQAFPTHPESSFRKRRSELSQEGYICDSGERRANGHGNDETVWLHRSFLPNPPPLQERAPPQREKLKEEGRAMAAQLHQFSESMRREGRGLLSAQLAEAARLMAALASAAAR